jgi:NAD(P)H-nitrite reductase large subunit
VEKGKVIICRCEEVTEEEIREAIRRGARSLREVKRVTRAGAGLCQGKTCSLLIARILAEVTGKDISEVELDRPRPPLRPVELGSFLKEFKP